MAQEHFVAADSTVRLIFIYMDNNHGGNDTLAEHLEKYEWFKYLFRGKLHLRPLIRHRCDTEAHCCPQFCFSNQSNFRQKEFIYAVDTSEGKSTCKCKLVTTKGAEEIVANLPSKLGNGVAM